jgi:putative ABC transport system permease protein
MVKNYFYSLARILSKRSGFSLINILGLAIGMAACLLIMYYVTFELSYDTFNSKAKSIYMCRSKRYSPESVQFYGSFTSSALGPSLKAEIPEILDFVRVHPQYFGVVISCTDKNGELLKFYEEKMYYTDTSFFRIFDYPLVSGDPNTALSEPNTILISERMAKKYFGDEKDVIGKTVNLDGGWTSGNYRITGILKNIPDNSHFAFDFLLPMRDLLINRQYQNSNGWDWYNFRTYVLVDRTFNPDTLNRKLNDIIKKYQGESLERENMKEELSLLPLLDIHLKSDFDDEFLVQNKSGKVYFYGLIALFILVIAWINYITLSTARSFERARETGIRKSIGAARSQLIAQFLFEAVCVNIIALVLSLIITRLMLPVLSGYIGKDISVGQQNDIYFWIALLAIFLVGAVLSGTYPAFVLSSFKTTDVIKGISDRSESGVTLRKILVVFQYVLSLALLIGTFTVYRQVAYMRNRELGMALDKVLVVKGPKVLDRNKDYGALWKNFKNDMLAAPGIKSISSSARVPGTGFSWGTGVTREGDVNAAPEPGNITWVDYDFFKTYGIEMVSGRSWSEEYSTDLDYVLVNEIATETYGLGTPEEALTKSLVLGGEDTAKILGVMKNFSWNSLQSADIPIIFYPAPLVTSFFSFKIETDDVQKTIKSIREKYDELFPGNPFDYFFMDEHFNSLYQADLNFGKIFGAFSILAVIVACLGLYGLSSFTALQRTKEIGIRKVFGAEVKNVLALLYRYFIVLIGIAAVIAIPVTYFGIGKWLENYAHKTPITAELFIIPVVALLVIAVLTVSFETIKAANKNPVSTLRAE